MKRLMAWMATAATLSFTVPAMAAQNDPRLDDLFLQLKAVSEVEQAREIEQSIWQIWLQSDNEQVTAHLAAGLRAMGSRAPRQALAIFDRIVEIAPDFAEGWNKRATVHYMLGNFDQSVADIQRTLALEPRHFGALSGLGLINLAIDRERQALEAFEAALKIYPLMQGADSHIQELKAKIKGRET